MNNAIVKSVGGLIFLVGCLALALFGAAGSFNFWQAWLLLAVWTICLVLITAYLIAFDPQLLASRTQVGPTAETQPAQQIIQGVAGLGFIGLFVVAGLDARLHWSAVPPLLCWLASVGVVLGFAIVWRVFRENSYTSAVIEVSNDQKVITTGPYRVVRHPMYSGASILLLCTSLALGSWVAMLVALLLIGIICIRLLAEETFLQTHLAGYATYCQQTPYRLVPFIW